MEADFEPSEQPQVQHELPELFGAVPEPERVSRCILFAAAGSLERVADLACLTHTDYRDVIVAGEYDREFRRLRNLSKPFS